MSREYTLPEMFPGEANDAWCRRAADCIPPEAIVLAVVAYLERTKRKRHTPTWSVIKDMLGHGSGVSQAIVAKYLERSPK